MKSVTVAPAQAGEKLGDEIFYTDKGGWRDHEYVSLGVDHMPVLAGRTPIQAWAPEALIVEPPQPAASASCVAAVTESRSWWQ